ncbi:hypothetical protein D7M11_24980 [Paenibacillus ginsengarvi]|uniref:Uncharacterized protein n=2 Tax=Paenibacillus ginsengarvi TaxID=400777 RepID=A0A3B0BUW9_9BACL|nr:hypothetical protein D7M11_24980 [Paenibacillus ginsengarvi]
MHGCKQEGNREVQQREGIESFPQNESFAFAYAVTDFYRSYYGAGRFVQRESLLRQSRGGFECAYDLIEIRGANGTLMTIAPA